MLENYHTIMCSSKTVRCFGKGGNACVLSRSACAHACMCDLLRTFKCSETNDLCGEGWAKAKSGSRVLGLIYLGILKGYAGWLQQSYTHTWRIAVCLYAHVCVSEWSMLIVQQPQISEGEVPESSIMSLWGGEDLPLFVSLCTSSSSSLIITPPPSTSSTSPSLSPFNNSATDQLH